MGEYKIGEYDITQVQAVMLEILTEVDRICTKHNIKYILDGGTMIGAVRHNGFIPWDDDLDIAMLREDYEKLLEVCKTELSDQFLWHSAELESKHPLNFTKLRKKGTVYKERRFASLDVEQGIFIDIFPIDDVDRRKMKFQLSMLSFIHIVKFTKMKLYKKKKRIFLLPFCLIPKKTLDRWAKALMVMGNKNKSAEVYKFCHAGKMKPVYPRSLYEDVIRHPFCGKEFYIPRDYDLFLRERYGDYMQLPPEEKRIMAHGVVECKL